MRDLRGHLGKMTIMERAGLYSNEGRSTQNPIETPPGSLDECSRNHRVEIQVPSGTMTVMRNRVCKLSNG